MEKLVDQCQLFDMVCRDLGLEGHHIDSTFPASVEYRWTRQTADFSLGDCTYMPLRVLLSPRYGALHFYRENETGILDGGDFYVGVSSIEDLVSNPIIGSDAVLPLTASRLYRKESRAFLEYVELGARALREQASFASLVATDPDWNWQVRVLGLPVASVDPIEPVQLMVETMRLGRPMDVLHTEPPVRSAK